MGIPDTATIRSALELARRAPVPHGRPTWRWESADGAVRLHTAPGSALDDREAVLAAGGALHHAVLAFAAFGWHAEITGHPRGTCLATLELTAREAAPADIDRAAALIQRRTDHRRYADWDVDPVHITALAAAAAELDVVAAVAVGSARAALVPSIAYAQELTVAMIVAARGPRPAAGPGTLLVLGTADDTAAAHLRTGQAVGAVLLAATGIGLASCALTHPLARPGVREAIADEIGVVPHILVRIGQPVG